MKKFSTKSSSNEVSNIKNLKNKIEINCKTVFKIKGKPKKMKVTLNHFGFKHSNIFWKMVNVCLVRILNFTRPYI